MIEIPGYTLLRQLGHGGMGTVHLAVQQSLGREVALKILSETFTQGDTTSERFLREARTAANLHHPHIVPIHDFGVHAGIAYIAMEFEPGGTVSPGAGQPCDPDETLRIVRDIAIALDYAHGKGVVHRDVKPENILRRTDGSCMLSDFGIARAIEAETLLTREGTSIGTPHYMSPEQLRGEKVDGRADLYSLGVVLYQLLTGGVPYSGSDGWAIGMQHLTANIPRLPQTLARLQPLLDGLMAKSAAARPQTGAEVVRRIDALRSEQTPAMMTTPLTPTPLPLPPAHGHYRRWLIVATATVAVALAYLAFDKFVLAPQRMAQAVRSSVQAIAKASAMKSIAVLPFENLSEDKTNAYFATGMQDEILTRLAGIHDLKVISRTSTEQYASHPPNLKIVAEQLGVATVLEGSVQKVDGKVRINLQLIDAHTDTHLWAQNYDRDLKDVFAVQSDVAEKVADALKAQLLPAESARIANVPTQDPEAYDLYLRAGSHANRAFDQDALVLAEMPQAIVLYQQVLERDPHFALAASALATAHIYMYWYASDHAAAHLVAARTAAEHALALQPNLGEGHLALALYYYWGHRDYAQALQQLDLARRMLPNNASLELVSASIARRQGHWDDAIAGYQRAMVLGPRSSQYPGQLGQTYQVLRRYALAEQVYAEAATLTEDAADERVRYALNDVIWKGDLTTLRSALGALHSSDDGYAGNAINIYHMGWWTRDYQAAAKTAETSSTVYWIDRSNVILPARLYLAWAYEALGEHEKATALHTSLKDQAQTALVEQPDDPNLHLTLAFADAGLGLKQDALSEGQKVAALMPVSKDALSGPDYLVFLAQLQVRLGNNDSALDLLEQLSAIPAGHVLSPALLKLDPVWDPLRKDPRFQKLIADAEAAHVKIRP